MNDKKAENFDDSEENKILVSFYLTPKTLEKVDDFLFYAKKRLPMGKRRKLTKSVFYEAALRIILENQEIKDEESLLWKTIFEIMHN